MVAGKPLSIRFSCFDRVLDESPSDIRQLRIEPMEKHLLCARVCLVFSFSYGGPSSAIARFPFRIRHHSRTELIFFLVFLGHYIRVEQTFQSPLVCLKGVLQVENLRACLPRLFRSFRRISLQCLDPVIHDLDEVRLYDITLMSQLRDGILPLSGSGIARDEHKVVIMCAVWVPPQKLLALDGLTILVHAENCHV